MRGAKIASAAITTLTAGALDAHNSFDAPDAVPAPKESPVTPGAAGDLVVTLPKASVSKIRVTLVVAGSASCRSMVTAGPVRGGHWARHDEPREAIPDGHPVCLLCLRPRTQPGPPTPAVASGLAPTPRARRARASTPRLFDEQTGALSPLSLAAETPNPSFLALHPNGKYLYAVNETHDGPEHSGLVTAYAIDAATGTLTEINHQLSRGADPCHLAIDATGRFLVVANYTAGNFAEFAIGADGRLSPSISLLTHWGGGPNKERQEGPHAHDVVFSRDNRHLIAVDLGLDQVFVYTFDPANGDIKPAPQQSAATAPGAGPRHFAFHPERPERVQHQRAAARPSPRSRGTAAPVRSPRARAFPRCRRIFTGRTAPPRSRSTPRARSFTDSTAGTTALPFSQ